MKPTRFTYNHTIVASYFGYITQSIINNLAPLLFLIFQDTFAISVTQITMLITINFGVQIAVDYFSARFVDKIGYRISIVSAHIFAAAGLVGLAVLPTLLPHPYVGLLIAVVLYAIGGGIIETLISPIVEACPTDNKASVMSLLHSFYCWGTVAVIVLSTLFLFAFGKGSWPILPCLWAILPLCNAFVFSRVPIATLTEGDEGMTLRELCGKKMFWLFILLMIASGASEQAMSQWASAFAEKGLNVSKTVGDLTGPCMFSILMGCSRVFYAKYSEKVNLVSFIIGSGILCVGSYLLAAFAPTPILSLAGCALCGLSVGILWPGVFSIASAYFPKGGTAMFAILALAGDLGCGGGPTVVGTVADAFGEDLKPGLVAALIFPIVLIICSLIYKKARKAK
ncbi:MAG: MFS transporter [Clostridia bacterium]|nr:MFS transporter [Clostridia bacterium]